MKTMPFFTRENSKGACGGYKIVKPMSMSALGPRPDPKKTHPLAMRRILLGHEKDPPRP